MHFMSLTSNPVLSPPDRWDRLLCQVQIDSNRWRSEARNYKVKYDESRKQIDKYQQNEIFNYNCNPRNQNLYKSRMKETLLVEEEVVKEEITSGDKAIEDNEEEIKGTDDSDKDKDKDIKTETDGQTLAKDCPVVQSSAESLFACLQESKSANDGTNEEHLCYKCMECEHSFPTNYQMNLHLLQEHANIEMGFPSEATQTGNQFAHKEPEQRSAGETQTMTNTSTHSESNSSSEGVFKCHYHQCKRAFTHFCQLKNHFSMHTTNVNRLLSHIYSGCATDAVLNRLRGKPFGSHRPQYKAQHKRLARPYAARNGNACNRTKVVSISRSLLKVNGNKHHFICNDTYQTLANRSPRLAIGSHLLNSYPLTSCPVVPIVSTPDIISQDSSDEDLEYMTEDMNTSAEDFFAALDVKPDLTKTYSHSKDSSFGISFAANHQ